jgi:hypothetical protein
MKKSELLKAELQALTLIGEKFQRSMVDGKGNLIENHKEVYNAFFNGIGKDFYEKKERLEKQIRTEEKREVEVGDGVTVCLYSDRHAGTIIKRTKASITVQYDKATVNPEFKPEMVAGGFGGHCTNQNEQTYTYERDLKGTIEIYRWSEKYGRFQNGDISIINGRRTFYDYNF